MPILDIQEDVKAELPRLFVLKKGAQQASNGRVGREQPHWRAHLSPGGSASAVRDFGTCEQVTEQDGKPTKLRAFLAGDTVGEIFDPWMKEYVAGGKLLRMCDTQQQQVYLQDGEYVSDNPIPCIHNAEQPCKCMRRGGLKVHIEGLAHVGYVEVQTGSVRDIRTITARLKKIEQLLDQLNGLRAAYGLPTMTMASVPVIIRRSPAEVTYNDNGQRKSTGTKYFIELEPDPDWFESQRDAIRRAASMRLEDMQQRPVALIESSHIQRNGHTIDAATGEIIDDNPFEDGSYALDDEVDFMDQDGAPEVPRITDEQMDRIDDLGLALAEGGKYTWAELKIPALKKHTERQDITGLGDLTRDEGEIVIGKMEAALEKQKDKAAKESKETERVLTEEASVEDTH
jgi:translation initiation factor 2B subunit (eIF-2B alpha/beta/delta family)